MNHLSLFDAHAHYDDHRFAAEYAGGTDRAIADAHDAGICGIVNVGANLQSSRNSVELSGKYDFIYASVGIHPSDGDELGIDALSEAMLEIRKLAAHDKVVAIGEIGLDYHYDGTNRECQAAYFRAQMELAGELSLPVIIHSRDAMGDTLSILSEYPSVTGVMHSFSGSAEIARQLCDKGWYISFSGPLTYRNAVHPKKAAAVIPEDRIMIETDCPYLPPVPHRGELNSSIYLHYTCEAAAAIRGVSPERIADITVANAKRFYRI